MDRKRKAMFEARARIIKALAHPTRLAIVDELKSGPRCVCEIHAVTGADRTTVSKHLSVLKNSGIVQDEKRGLQVFYNLRCPCVSDFFACAEKVLRTTAKEQMRTLNAGRKAARYGQVTSAGKVLGAEDIKKFLVEPPHRKGDTR